MAEENGKLEQFGALFEGKSRRIRSGFEMGEKVRGTVVAIDSNSIFVDFGARSEGILDRFDFEDEEGNLTLNEGDEVEAYFLGSENGEMRFARQLGGDSADPSLWDAFQAGIPVEGMVESERTGGYEVKVGSARGFCPYSQIDIHKMPAGAYIGQRFRFRIMEYDEFGGNLVLSRRELLSAEREEQKAELRERLEPGAVIEGRVTKLMPFGAFVDIGGTDGLIPISELAWGRTENVEDVVKVGDRVKVMVRDVDWERDRISLSLRQAQGNPWNDIGNRYVTGQHLNGRVTKLMPFGAFVELEPGIDGLVHISKLGGGRRIRHPKEVVSEGVELRVTVENIDPERQRISLSLEDSGTAARAAGGEGEEVAVGAILTGVVEGIKEFGVFVGLPDGRTGLLHVSELDVQGRDRAGALARKYPAGMELAVAVTGIKGDRISLTLPEKWQKQSEDVDMSQFMADSKQKDLGSLGDALDRLNL